MTSGNERKEDKTPLHQLVRVINDGLFDASHPPDTMLRMAEAGFRVMNWNRVSLALEALAKMPWHQLDSGWEYFLDSERFRPGQHLDLHPPDNERYLNLLGTLISQTREGMRVLSSFQLESSPSDALVVVDTQDLSILAESLQHIERTTALAAIDDAIKVKYIQPGSVEIGFITGPLSNLGLGLAICLGKKLIYSISGELFRHLKEFRQIDKPAEDVNDDDIREFVHAKVKEDFWKESLESLRIAFEGSNGSMNEAKNKVEAAAKEIADRSQQVKADWRPPAIVKGLPNGLTVELNSQDPEVLGTTIRAIAESRFDSEEKV